MRKEIVKLFYDLETTGLNHKRNCIHQLSGLIEVNGEVVEEIDLKLAPHPKAVIDADALKAGNVTMAQIIKYPEWKSQYRAFLSTISKYVDRYKSTEKIKLIGYNNASSDNDFLRRLFELANNNYFGAFFWSDSVDVMVLASEFLEYKRDQMKSFKLKTVAAELGIEVDESKLHNSSYDIELTRKVYNIVTYREQSVDEFD